MCLNIAHSAGDMASPSKAAAEAFEGTVSWHVLDTCDGMKGDGSAQKKARMVAATPCTLVSAGSYKPGKV